MGPGLNGRIFCFLILTFYATSVEMSPRHHPKMARLFDDHAWVDDFESSLSAVNEADDADDAGRDAGDVDTALEDAQAAKVAAQKAAKKADKAVVGAKQVKAEQEEAKAEKEEEEAAKEQEEKEKEEEEAEEKEEEAETTNPTDAGAVDTALEDAQAAAAAAKKAAKKADKAVVEAKEVKAEQEEAKAEKEEEEAAKEEEKKETTNSTVTANTTESDNEQESVRPTIGDDFLQVNLTESNITDITDIANLEGLGEASTASSKTESKEINDWATHCFKGWDQYPCKLGFRHGCKQGICWSQCDAAWRLDWLTAEWCWVMQPKEENQSGTGDTSEWKYLDCDTDADCTKQYAYRRKCKGACSMGWMKLRS